MAIIDKINLGLLKAGKSGSDLEKALGLSHSVYSQWNTGKTKPAKKHLPKIADFLGVSLEWLLDEETEKPAAKSDGLSEKDSEFIRMYNAAPAWLQDQIRSLLEAEVSNREVLDTETKG